MTAATVTARKSAHGMPNLDRSRLDAVAARLATEYPQVCPGSVLRCLLRAAHGLRVAGVSSPLMPAEAERVTRGLLERRVGRV